MKPELDETQIKLLAAAFRMPSAQTMTSRKTSITNAFVSAIIPVIRPSAHDIHEALCVLGMDAADVRCAYCNDKATEWDHLRPLVVKRRPTGFISEIANLVPSCGKCNQSKGNSAWSEWMLNGSAKLSPTGRGLSNIHERIALLDAYEHWRVPRWVDFDAIIAPETWQHYWSLCEQVIEDMRRCQEFANAIRATADRFVIK